MTGKSFNFSAGPGVIPRPVLETVQRDMLDFAGTGSCLMELSHRSLTFETVLAEAESDLRTLLEIPEDYYVLFMQGGATAQFSAILLNLVMDENRPVDYIVSGAWSEKALQEAQRLGFKTHVVVDTKKTGHDGAFPPMKNWSFSPDANFLFYCDNETIHGVECPTDWATRFADRGVPVVCDMSSNILSRKVDVSKYACIFAGAQKNIGPAGLTIVILKKRFLSQTRARVAPLMMDYATFADYGSMYNTPPTFSIYVSGLVFKWLLNLGGVSEIEKQDMEKAQLLYDTIVGSQGFYRCPVQSAFRSRMNIPFRIYNSNGEPWLEKESEFIKAAEHAGLTQLKGHRSVGGMRASLYNAMTLDGIHALIKFMKSFRD